MEIKDLKTRILEKIREKRSGAAGKADLAGLVTLSPKKSSAAGKAAKFRKPKNYTALAKLFEEYRRKFSDLELENVKLSEEKHKTAEGIEALRSKLYSAEKELKGRNSRLAQLEETIKIKEKKLAEAEKLYRDEETDKKETALKLKSAEEEKAQAQKSISQLGLEIDAREKSLEKSLEKNEKLRKDLEDMAAGAAEELKKSEAGKKELEAKIDELKAGLEEAGKARHEDKAASQAWIDKLNLEIEALKKAIGEKDERIEEDIKSCEKIANLINEMKEAGKRRR